jgi:hypothetical protein
VSTIPELIGWICGFALAGLVGTSANGVSDGFVEVPVLAQPASSTTAKAATARRPVLCCTVGLLIFVIGFH